jgi:hypothetical protein
MGKGAVGVGGPAMGERGVEGRFSFSFSLAGWAGSAIERGIGVLVWGSVLGCDSGGCSEGLRGVVEFVSQPWRSGWGGTSWRNFYDGKFVQIHFSFINSSVPSRLGLTISNSKALRISIASAHSSINLAIMSR